MRLDRSKRGGDARRTIVACPRNVRHTARNRAYCLGKVESFRRSLDLTSLLWLAP